MCVGEEEDGFFKSSNFIVHLMVFYVWFEMGQVVDSTFAMSRCNDVSRILADILCDFCPSSFYC
jgi:hypothetical protein